MGIDKTRIYSKVLNKQMNITVSVPENYKDVNLPVLYFIHVRSGNEEIMEQLHINNIASKLINEKSINPMIIVCPN